MPFPSPTRDQLVGRVVGDVEAELQSGAALIPNTLERALSIATAGLAHTQHGHLAHNARQVIIDTADDTELERWAVIFLGVNARKQPSKAEFSCEFTGTLAEAPIPVGTRVVRKDGAVFETTFDAELPAAPPLEVTITVRAIEAGEAGNTVPGTILTLESAVADIEADVEVLGSGSAPIGGGTDLERIADLKARLLAHLQTPPKGGGPGDYIAWAKEVSFVTRAWELPLQLGPSTVLVIVVQDTFDEDGFFEQTIFPDAGQLTEVEEYIAARCPVTVGALNLQGERGLDVQAPDSLEIDFEIALSPNTPEAQAQVEAQLQDLLLRRGGPKQTITISQIREAISLAPLEDFHDLTAPVADVVAGPTELHMMGTIIWS